MADHKFLEAARRGIKWIVAQQKPDGSFCNPDDGVGSYYKIPYVLASVGCQREANLLLDWVAKHNFSEDGDFRAPVRKAREPAHDAWPIYANAWLVQGAHRLGRWDLSLPGAAFLLSYQTASGGFYALDGEKRYLEPVCTSWGGLAALATGHLTAACRAGDLLVRLVAAQPSSDRFYYRLDLEGKIVTAVPKGEELFYFVDTTRRRQIYFNPGIALIFLTHLYRATSESKYLEAGQELFLFTERCAADVHHFPPSGKLGLGSALLFNITGSQQARRAALQVGNYLVESQTPAGFWRLPDEKVYSSVKDKDGIEVRLDLSAEFSAFLAEIAACI